MRKKIILGLFSFITFFAFTISVYAGNVTIGFNGSDSVAVNNNIDIIVRASDINGLTEGLATAQGDIIYDDNYLEYVKFEDVSSLLSVSYGTKTRRFVALGLSGEYISSDDNLIKLTFKAKNIGSTTISVNNIVVGDTKAIIHGSNVVDKTINIVAENNSNSTPEPAPTQPANSTPAKAPSKKPSNSNSNKSSDASLSKLIINNSKVSPNFDKNITEYNVTVPNDVNKLQIDYTTSDKKATVKIIGNDNLKDEGETVVQVVVTAEDGSTKTYTLKVTKSSDVIDNRLKSLDVKESPVAFNEDTYEYSLKVNSNIKKLTIDAIPKSKYSKVEILGNNDLERGNNVILIKLTDKNGYQNYYKLNVKKDSSFKIFGINIKYILYFILALLLLLLLLLIIILFKRKKKKEKAAKNTEVEEVYVVPKEDLEKLRDPKSQFKPEEENVDIYDDVVTKDEIIDAIEERNPKKLKMLLAQEEANKLKEELMQEESEDK